MEGKQEVPPTTSEATGEAHISIDYDNLEVKLDRNNNDDVNIVEHLNNT